MWVNDSAGISQSAGKTLINIPVSLSTPPPAANQAATIRPSNLFLLRIIVNSESYPRNPRINFGLTFDALTRQLSRSSGSLGKRRLTASERVFWLGEKQDKKLTFIVEVDYVAPIVSRDIAFIDCASPIDVGLCRFGFRCAHDHPGKNKQSAISEIEHSREQQVRLHVPAIRVTYLDTRLRIEQKEAPVPPIDLASSYQRITPSVSRAEWLH